MGQSSNNRKDVQLVTIILTYNSEASVSQVIQSCKGFTSRYLVVDSFSSDQTISIVESFSCEVVQHKFENYSKQRNWAQEHANLKPDDWVLHVDSDEVVSAELAQSIHQAVSTDDKQYSGYLMQRLSYFLGKPIRFGHINPSWHLRLFKASKGFCEDRLYDQHYVVGGETKKLQGLLLDLQLITLEQWTASHNRWSSAEAQEIYSQLNQSKIDTSRSLPASLKGDPRMQKRWLKNNIWYRSPILLRSFIYFTYSYFIRLGFLDGKVGLIYHVLQSFWFRFLVDSKIIEMQISARKRLETKN